MRVRDSAPHSQVRDNTGANMDDFTYKDQTVCSYQQISCLDSVIRCVARNLCSDPALST